MGPACRRRARQRRDCRRSRVQVGVDRRASLSPLTPRQRTAVFCAAMRVINRCRQVAPSPAAPPVATLQENRAVERGAGVHQRAWRQQLGDNARRGRSLAGPARCASAADEDEVVAFLVAAGWGASNTAAPRRIGAPAGTSAQRDAVETVRGGPAKRSARAAAAPRPDVDRVVRAGAERRQRAGVARQAQATSGGSSDTERVRGRKPPAAARRLRG